MLTITSNEPALVAAFGAAAVAFLAVMINRAIRANTSSLCSKTPNVKTIKLRDGRVMSYSRFGAELDRNNPPQQTVLFFPGCPMSHTAPHPEFGQIVERLGIQIIIPDRPGIGLSSPDPSRTLLSVADDIQQLLTELAIETVSIVGFSSGCPHALAAAKVLGPKTVKKVGLVGPIVFSQFASNEPTGQDAQKFFPFQGMNIINTSLTKLIQKVPLRILLTGFFKLLGSMLADVDAGLQQTFSNQAEANLFANNEVDRQKWLKVFRDSYVEFYRQGPTSLLQELVNCGAKSWGFFIEEVMQHVDIWQGENDSFVPPGHSIYLSKRLKRSTVHLVSNMGHYSTLGSKMEEILQSAKW